MLGCEISDPYYVESGGAIRGMELLPIKTVLQQEKVRCQSEGKLRQVDGLFSEISGCEYSGYEIHMGQTYYVDTENSDDKTGQVGTELELACEEVQQTVLTSNENHNVYGSYVHGLFDKGNIASVIVNALSKKKGVVLLDGSLEDYQTYKEKQYDKLADILRKHLNMEEIYGMLREARLE